MVTNDTNASVKISNEDTNESQIVNTNPNSLVNSVISRFFREIKLQSEWVCPMSAVLNLQ